MVDILPAATHVATGQVTTEPSAVPFVVVCIYALVQKILKPHGDHVPELTCPHCQQQGSVYREVTTETSGIDGSKAAGAVITGGASIWFTGLSGKAQIARMTCTRCGSVWTVRR